MVANAECDSSQSHRAVRMSHGDEDGPKATVRPRDVGLDATAEPGAVAAFGLAGHQTRFWNPAETAYLCVEQAQRLLGARRQMSEVFLQGVVVKADREDRLRLGYAPPQPSSSVGSAPNWRSNSWGSSRCSPWRARIASTEVSRPSTASSAASAASTRSSGRWSSTARAFSRVVTPWIVPRIQGRHLNLWEAQTLMLVRQSCASATRKQPVSAGDNRTRVRLRNSAQTALRSQNPCSDEKGAYQNRTGVNGFAGRCVATPPRRRGRVRG